MNDPGPTIGLIAGWGNFPVTVADKLMHRGHRVVCVAITGHASPKLNGICDRVLWSGVGRFGSHVRFFQRHGVVDVTMAGKLFKSDILYGGSILWRHLPDVTCLRTFAPLLLGRRRDARDDQLLTAVINTYHRRGMHVRSATDLVPELLVNQGSLTARRLTSPQTRDAEIGWQIAKTMGGLDIGQAITIKDGTVIAVEAMEGTDACIARTGRLCGAGWTLIKVSKPNQDMRFDVPTIGIQTVRNVAESGGKAIVIEADRTILLDAEETIHAANKLGVAIVAISQDAISQDASENLLRVA